MIGNVKQMVVAFQSMCTDLVGFIGYIQEEENQSSGFAKDIPLKILQDIDNDILGLSNTFGGLVNVLENLVHLMYDTKAHIKPSKTTVDMSRTNGIALLNNMKVLGNLTQNIQLNLIRINRNINAVVKAIEAYYPGSLGECIVGDSSMFY